MSTGPAQPAPQQQQQQRARKPPFADWPTIKILTPPQGRFSPKIDEWCLTYCSQTVSGRIHSKEPNCHSLCIRKVFPHEVRNVISYKKHRNVDTEGKAKYPLPAEGQAVNIPRYLGGKVADDAEGRQKVVPGETKYWDEGWYLWTSNSRSAALQKTNTMMLDLERQQQLVAQQEQRREVWQDYQEHLKQAGSEGGEQNQSNGGKWWGPIVPPKAIPDTSLQSLLIPLPPDFPPFWDRIHKLLAPSHQVLGILRESVTSGEQKEFAQRIWEKAWTDEPLLLATRTFSRAYERWKERDTADEDDDTKGSH